MFPETALPPQEPQPNDNDGSNLKLNKSPIPPCELGEFTRTRQEGIFSA